MVQSWLVFQKLQLLMCDHRPSSKRTPSIMIRVVNRASQGSTWIIIIWTQARLLVTTRQDLKELIMGVLKASNRYSSRNQCAKYKILGTSCLRRRPQFLIYHPYNRLISFWVKDQKTVKLRYKSSQEIKKGWLRGRSALQPNNTFNNNMNK